MNVSVTPPAPADGVLRPSAPYTAVKLGLECLEAVLIMASNVLTVAAIRRSHRLLEIPTNAYVVCLAVSDGAVGFMIPFMVALNVADDDRIWRASVCALRGPYYAMFSISLGTMLAIAVDRYLAVVHPLAYRKLVTRTRAVAVAAAIFVGELVVVVSVTCYYGERAKHDLLHTTSVHAIFPKSASLWMNQTLLLGPVLGTIVLYLSIYVRLRRSRPLVAPSGASSDQTSRRAKAYTKMMALVLGYMLLACMPYYILAPLYDVRDPDTPTWYLYAFDLSVLLYFSNSFMNPFIYSWNSSSFQDAYKNILVCTRQSRDCSSDSTRQTGGASTRPGA